MKKFIILTLVTVTIVIGCRPRPVPTIVYRPRFFVTGTYVYSEQTEFFYVWDTIIICRLPTEGNFHITRLTTYQRKKPGSANDPEYQVEEFNGIYDPMHLKILLPGRINEIEFKPEDPSDFWIGNQTYSKIEN
jgi:hypothetical protein